MSLLTHLGVIVLDAFVAVDLDKLIDEYLKLGHGFAIASHFFYVDAFILDDLRNIDG